MIDNTIPGHETYKNLPVNFDYEIIRLHGETKQLNSREVLAYCYSIIFCYAQAYDFDYLLCLETDVIIPQQGLLRLVETAQNYKGIIAPLSCRANGEHLQIYHDDMELWSCQGTDNLYRMKRTPYTEKILDGSTFRIGSATFSCVLIPVECLKGINVKWSVRHFNHPDGFFYESVKEAGIPVWCDSSVKCEHLQRSFEGEVIW